MAIRLPNAPAAYSEQDQAQLRRDIEAFSRKPLASYSENAEISSPRIEAVNLTVYHPVASPAIEIVGPGAGYAVPTQMGYWTGNLLFLGRSDNGSEGGEVDFQGGGNGGAPWKTWSCDSYNGFMRWFESGTVRHQFDSTYGWHYNSEIGDCGHGVSWAVFAHTSRFNTVDYALAHSSAGTQTNLNVGAGGLLCFNINNGTEWIINSDRLYPNSDAVEELGEVAHRIKDVWLSGAVKVNSNNIISSRRTGWTNPTGTAQRGTFATDTVTLINLARAVKALIDDLHATAGHGLIGA